MTKIVSVMDGDEYSWGKFRIGIIISLINYFRIIVEYVCRGMYACMSVYIYVSSFFNMLIYLDVSM